MTTPRVSVIIPVYNRASLLPRTLDSVIAQAFRDWEIVLVDDGSTDSTAEVADAYARKLGDRLMYIRQENRGAGAARNRGIDVCRGRFVAFLDSDDEFRPRKLEKQMELFARRPELGFVFSDYATVDVDGTRSESVFGGEDLTARQLRYESIAPALNVCGNLFDTLIRGYFISTIVGLVRREVLGENLRFDTDLIFGEEWLFYLRVARTCPAGFVDEPLSVYHFQRGSLGRTDKQRNANRYRALLLAIHDTFADLTRSQRQAGRHNLAQLGRQMGCAAYRRGRFAEAADAFADALRFEPNLRTTWHYLQASMGKWLSRGVVATKAESSSQGVVKGVR